MELKRIVAIIGATCIGAALWDHCLPIGLLITPDSLEYLFAAKKLGLGGFYSINHLGELQPMTAFPPLYIAVLGVFGIFGDVETLAKWINFALLVTLIFAISRHFGSSLKTYQRCMLGVALAVSPILLRSFTALLSEGLFLTLLAMTLCQVGNVATWRALIIPAMLPITRYAGIFVGIGILAQNKLRGKTWLIFCPALVWATRNYLSGVAPLQRGTWFHPPSWSELSSGLTSIGALFVGENSLVAMIVGACLLLVVFGRVLRSRAAFIGAIYILGVVLSKTFIDAEISLNQRILAPLFIFAIFVIGESARDIKPILVNLFLVSWFAIGVTTAADIVQLPKRNLYNQLNAGMIADDIDAFSAVASNAHDYIRVVTETPCLNIPSTFFAHTREPNPVFGDEIQVLKNTLAKNGVIVWIKGVHWRWYLPSLETLLKEGFVVTKDTDDYLLLRVRSETYYPG